MLLLLATVLLRLEKRRTVSRLWRLKVFIQRSSDGLFLKGLNAWVGLKEEARDFMNSTPAIDFCIEHELREVRLHLSFDDPQYDFKMDVFRTETRMLTKLNRELRQQQRELLAKTDGVQAQTKGRKKQIPFPRKEIKHEKPDANGKE
jgi:hypothetical protein